MTANLRTYLSYTNVVTFDFPYCGKKGFLASSIFFIPKRLHNPKLTLHFQKLFSCSSSLTLFHNLIMLANLLITVTHNNTRRRTTTHDDSHPYNRSRRRWPQRRTPRFGLYHMLCYFCMLFLFFFFAYGFYWLVVMTSSSASVFLVDKRLFWDFDDDHNSTIVITFFVVIIVHLASVAKPLLLCSLLYSQTSSLLFSIMKLVFSFLLRNFLCSLFVNIQLIFVMFLYRMSDEISLILHHNGKFIQNANGALEYVRWWIHVWKKVETYLINVWTPKELCKACRNYMKLLTLS